MIVHCVGEVIGGNAVRFQQNMIHVVFGNGQLALDQVIELKLIFNGAGAAEPQNPGLSGIQLCLNVLHGTVTPGGVFAIVAGGFLICFLLLPHGGQLFLGAEAGVSLALRDKLLGIYMVNGGSLALTVGAIQAVVTIVGSAFVKLNAIVLEGVDQHLHGTGDLPLGIGVLHAKEQNAAGLVSHTLGGQSLHQVAQVNKTGGRGGHTGNNCPFGDISGGEPLFQSFRRVGHIGEKQISQSLIIHSNLPRFLKFILYNIAFPR